MKLSNVPISKKLILAFATILLAIGAMGATVYVNLEKLKDAGVVRSVANQMVRDTAAAEYSLARQENSYRGYLVSNDRYYIDRTNSHRATFKGKLNDLRGVGSPEADAKVDAVEKAADVWFDNIVTKGEVLARDPATHAQALAAVGNNGEADKLMTPVEEAMDGLKAINNANLDAVRLAQDRATLIAEWSVIIGLAATMLIAVLMSWVLSQGIARPVQNMTNYMRKLMAVMGLGIKQGDTITVTVEGGDEKANASAMEKFFSENL